MTEKNQEKSIPKQNSGDMRKFYEIYLEVKDFIFKDIESLNGNFDYVNKFWDIMLDNRENFPDFNKLFAFLKDDTSLGVGSIFSKKDRLNEDEKHKILQDLFNGYVIKTLREVPKEFIQSIPINYLGCPFIFEYDSIISHLFFISIISGTYRIIQFLKKYLDTNKKLNVLEIGAGWGSVAYQLLHLLNIDNYVICDLHENLYISSFFLQASFPEKNAVMVLNDHTLDSNSLVFCSPKKLENIEGKFDLVINMHSFQEMYISEVQRYLKYAKEHLSENGIVYSENGIIFNDQSRPSKASDYGYYENFKILNLDYGRRFTPHLFNGNKHEVVLANKKSNKDDIKSNLLDALCYLTQIKLFKETEAMNQSFIEDNLSENDTEFLLLTNNFFNTKVLSEKMLLLDSMMKYDHKEITYLIKGFVELTQFNDTIAIDCLKNAVKHGLSGEVKSNTLLIIYSLKKSKSIRIEIENEVQSNTPEMQHLATLIINAGGYERRLLRYNTTHYINIDIKPGIQKFLMRAIPKLKRTFKKIFRLEKYIPYSLTD